MVRMKEYLLGQMTDYSWVKQSDFLRVYWKEPQMVR